MPPRLLPGPENGCTKHLLHREKIPQVHLSDEETDGTNHVILPCSWLYTLMSLFPDATPPPADSWSKSRKLGA